MREEAKEADEVLKRARPQERGMGDKQARLHAVSVALRSRRARSRSGRARRPRGVGHGGLGLAGRATGRQANRMGKGPWRWAH